MVQMSFPCMTDGSRPLLLFLSKPDFPGPKRCGALTYNRQTTECKHHGMRNENLLNNEIDIDNTDFLEKDK